LNPGRPVHDLLTIMTQLPGSLIVNQKSDWLWTGRREFDSQPRHRPDRF